MTRAIGVAAVLAALTGPVFAKDRVCTPVDVARFERMLGGVQKGEYRTDPRFQITVHYLGTTIVKGTCNVRLRPAD